VRTPDHYTAMAPTEGRRRQATLAAAAPAPTPTLAPGGIRLRRRPLSSSLRSSSTSSPLILSLVALLGCCAVTLAAISRPSSLGSQFFGLKPRRSAMQWYVCRDRERKGVDE